MSQEQSSRVPQLLMLRVWSEDLGEGKTEWRGKLQSVASGETRYFREWNGLVDCLEEMLRQNEPERSERAEP